jgi:hypothetical protein
MLALIYLAIATYVGFRLCRTMVPGLDGSRMPPESRAVARWVIYLPTAFLCGTLLVTWTVYLVAWLLRDTTSPLVPANAIALCIVLAGMGVGWLRRRPKTAPPIGEMSPQGREAPRRRPWLDITVLVGGLVIGAAIMFHTCRLEGTTLVLGRSAFGDLNIHLGMARSFSYGKNFPTGYVAFAGTDIRYHFMFYFLVGNLEFLGLPLDWAINLPSILSFTAVLLLIHGLGSSIARDARVGALAVLFFLLRSSPAAFFYFFRPAPAGVGGSISLLLKNRRYIGLTAHEPWGIWNLNVYVVERHFAFALGLVLIAVLYLVRASGIDTGPSLFRRFRVGARRPSSTPG